MDDVVRTVAGGDDRRVVDDVRSRDPDERTVPRTRHRSRLQRLQREAGRTRHRDPRRAEVRRALEVNHGRSEGIRLRRRVALSDRLDARRAADPDVRQLRRVVDAQVVGETLIRGVEQEIPHLLGLARMIRDRRVSRVNRKPNGLVAEVHLDGAFLSQMASRQQPAQLAQPGRRSGVANDAVVVVGPVPVAVIRRRRLPHERDPGNHRRDRGDQHPPVQVHGQSVKHVCYSLLER